MRKRLILAIAPIVMALAIAGGFQNPTSVHGVSYVAAADGDLLWYRHDGREDGTRRWAYDAPRQIGNGWNFKQLFSGGDGVIYAVTDNGDLLWYRHDGREDGTRRWAYDAPRQIGNGWNFKQLFSGGDGVIYAVTANGDLLWYRHDGREDGTRRWAYDAPRQIGNGWNFKQLFYGGDGVIYAVTDNSGSSGASSVPGPSERATPKPGGLEAPRQEQLPPPENPTCRNYAYRAIDQYKLTIKYAKCRVNSDARWNADYKGHYNWCLTAPQAARTNELKLRDDHLYRCGAQSTYD